MRALRLWRRDPLSRAEDWAPDVAWRDAAGAVLSEAAFKHHSWVYIFTWLHQPRRSGNQDRCFGGLGDPKPCNNRCFGSIGGDNPVKINVRDFSEGSNAITTKVWDVSEGKIVVLELLENQSIVEINVFEV